MTPSRPRASGAAKKSAGSSYTARDITVLEGLDPVRKRPGMYIGGVDADGLHHLVWEILDNGVDEAMNGHASRIDVTLHRDGALSVADDGRGIPVDVHESTGRPALEVIMTTLHAGGKFDRGTYRAAGGLHGVGASVVNALSESLRVVVSRDRARWEMRFARGIPQGKLRRLGPAKGSGTTVTFAPDPEIFPDPKFDVGRIAARLRETGYLHRGLELTLRDEAAGTTETWRQERGLVDFLDALLEESGVSLAHEAPFEMRRDPLHDGDGRLELVLGWTEATRESLRSYVNGIPTATGGSHEAGYRDGLVKAVRNYMETHSLAPRGVTISSEDAREGVLAVLSVFLPNPQFQGQTKDRLNNPEARAPVDGAVRQELEMWLNRSPTAAARIVNRVILAARARAASRAAAATARRAEAPKRAVLPGKLSDCASRDRSRTEIFIVEGDSAGGSAKQGRDRMIQAVLPLRGKILNAEQATLPKVRANRELQDIGMALGCGFGNDCDPEALRYRRVILLSDADADGHHITTLLLAFLHRFMRPLIERGRVFVAQPPLYRVDVGSGTRWASDERARDRILKELGNGVRPVITRFKGLGEMPPKVLWETTLNPKTRRLLRVQLSDGEETGAWIAGLLGRDPADRRALVGKGPADPDALDV